MGCGASATAYPAGIPVKPSMAKAGSTRVVREATVADIEVLQKAEATDEALLISLGAIHSSLIVEVADTGQTPRDTGAIGLHLVKAGLITVTVQRLQKEYTSLPVKVAILMFSVLEALTDGLGENSNRDIVSECGGIKVIVDTLGMCMETDDDSDPLVEQLLANASATLGNVAGGSHNHAQRCQRVVEEKGIETVIKLIEHTPTYDDSVLRGATRTLTNVTSGVGYAKRCNEVVALNGVEAMIKLLNHIPTLEAAVLSGASHTLSNLAAGEDSGPRAARIFEKGGVEALVSVAKVTPAEVFPALRSIATTNRYREKVIESGAGEVAKEFLKRTGGGIMRTKNFRARRAAHELVLVLIGGSDEGVVKSTPELTIKIFSEIYKGCLENAPNNFVYTPEGHSEEPQTFIWPPRSLPMMIHNIAAGERGRDLLIQLGMVPAILDMLRMPVSDDKTGRLHITQRWSLGALFNLAFVIDDDSDSVKGKTSARSLFRKHMKEGKAGEVLDGLKNGGVMNLGDEDEQMEMSKSIDFLKSILKSKEHSLARVETEAWGGADNAESDAASKGGVNAINRLRIVESISTQFRKVSPGDTSRKRGGNGGEERSESADAKPKGGHVMLSYNHGSKAIVQRVAQALQDNGIPIWVDWNDMGAGGSISIFEQMSRAVENAAAVFVFTSPGYQQSGNCKLECEYAFTKQKPILWIVTQKLNVYRPTGWLGLIQGQSFFYDLSSLEAEGREVPKLITSVREVMGDDTEKGLVIKPSPKPSPRGHKAPSKPTNESKSGAASSPRGGAASSFIPSHSQQLVESAKGELEKLKKDISRAKDALVASKNEIKACEAQRMERLDELVKAQQGKDKNAIKYAEQNMEVANKSLERACGDREMAVREWERLVRESEVAMSGVEAAQMDIMLQIKKMM